jgi:flagellar hook-length control protein FliK
MPITIVSALPKSASASNAGATDGSENAEATQDFASLLFGQLFASNAETPPVLGLTSAGGNVETDDQGAAADDSAQDATAALLVSLGLRSAPAESNEDGGIQAKSDDTTVDIIQTSAKTGTTTIAAEPPSSGLATENTESETLDTAKPIADGRAARNSSPANLAVSTLAAGDEKTATANNSRPTDSFSNSMQQAISGTTANSVGAPSHRDASLSVPTPVHDQRWSGDFANKIVWLASNNKQSAELTLNPPHMGSIEISLNMDRDKATATFYSANPEVRDTIEAALPRLREMFAGAGVELGQANVSSESFRQHAENGSGGNGGAQAASTAESAILVDTSNGAQSARASSSWQGNGMVDTFA